MGYIIFRNQVRQFCTISLQMDFMVIIIFWLYLQLLNVYSPKYETGGKYWPIVHDSTIFSLVLMQVIAIGIFGLKMLPVAAGLTFPLPILTLLFNEYCRKRFLPIFQSYPAEVLLCMLFQLTPSNPMRHLYMYTKKCFLPHHISMQCLIKKDKNDQINGSSQEFFDRLKSAYQDPTSLPIQYTDNLGRLNSPLLPGTDGRN